MHTPTREELDRALNTVILEFENQYVIPPVEEITNPYHALIGFKPTLDGKVLSLGEVRAMDDAALANLRSPDCVLDPSDEVSASFEGLDDSVKAVAEYMLKTDGQNGENFGEILVVSNNGINGCSQRYIQIIPLDIRDSSCVSAVRASVSQAGPGGFAGSFEYARQRFANEDAAARIISITSLKERNMNLPEITHDFYTGLHGDNMGRIARDAILYHFIGTREKTKEFFKGFKP